jgi:hypothetical protein
MKRQTTGATITVALLAGSIMMGSAHRLRAPDAKARRGGYWS